MVRDRGATARRPDTGCSVVLVEDHPVLRRRFARQLGDAGVTVCAAVGTLEAGREAVDRYRPDVAVIANTLPDGRGVDLCQALHDDVPHVIVLLHAGVVSPVEEQEALDAGVAAVVPKAIRSGGLVAAVLAYARRRA